MNQHDNFDFSDVLASSVHDMKNSLGMLLNSVEGLIESFPPQNQEQSKRYNTLQYEASRINSELVQLLTLYRMQENHLPLRIDQHFVIDILEDQIARNHRLVDESHIDLRFECDDLLEWYLDADLVGNVVHNVLVNCCRYTKKKIMLTAEMVNNALCITIADDGEGYPAAMINQPSVNVDEAVIGDGNTHLGLYFAEKIAAMHFQDDKIGYIQLSNGLPLGGGTFKMFLP